MGYQVDQEALFNWLKEGKENGAKYCLIICDTWEYATGFEDFPVYVMPGQDLAEIKKKYPPGGIEVFIEQFDLDCSDLKELADNYNRNTGLRFQKE